MRIAVFAAVALLAGCVTSPVAEITPGTYTLSIDTSFGGPSRIALRDKAASRADDYCATHGSKVARLINENETGVTGLTAMGVTIVFSCATPTQEH